MPWYHIHPNSNTFQRDHYPVPTRCQHSRSRRPGHNIACPHPHPTPHRSSHGGELLLLLLPVWTIPLVHWCCARNDDAFTGTRGVGSDNPKTNGRTSFLSSWFDCTKSLYRFYSLKEMDRDSGKTSFPQIPY